MNIKSNALKISSILGLLALTSCTELNDPYYSGPSRGYSDPYYDSGYGSDNYYSSRERERNARERDKIEREKDRIEEERRRLEEERRRQEAYRPPPAQAERCPSGFSPSEQKCSVEERRRGCKDMRLPGGLGCVRR